MNNPDSNNAIIRQDFSCRYENHPCELRKWQKSIQTKKEDRFKERFIKIFLISERNFTTYWYLRSKGAIEMEIARQRNLKHWYIFHPFCYIRLLWGIFTTALFLFCMVYIPFRCSFLNSFMTKYYLYAGRSVDCIRIASTIQLVLCVLWMTDIAGKFITGYYVPEARTIVLHPRSIFMNYIFPGFVIDVSSSLPVDYFIILVNGIEGYAGIDCKVQFFMQLYSMYSVIRYRTFFVNWYRLTKINKKWTQAFNVISSFIIFYFIFSWAVCLNIIIPEMTLGEKLYKDSRIQSWIQASKILEMTIFRQYVAAVMNAIHTVLGVDPSWDSLYSSEDFIMTLVIIITCNLYWLYFIIVILSSITSSNAMDLNIHLIRSQLKAYMQQKDYPVAVKKRLSRFYLYRYQAQYLSNSAILPVLTKSLRKEISIYSCQRLLYNSELFDSVPKKLMLKLMQRMNKEMFFPKDVIIQANTYGDCMYFICSGDVMVSSSSGREICVLKDGEFFGEIALVVSDKRRTATVTAITMTELYKFDFSDYTKLVRLYPDVQNRLEKFVTERYRTISEMERFDINKKYGAG